MIGFLRDDNTHAIAPVQGQHAIDKADVFQSQGITPEDPGKWNSYRTAPVVPAPRTFDAEEAAALGDVQTELEHRISTTKKGYRALRNITKLDTEVNAAHEKYRICEAGQEYQRQNLKQQSAKYLHGLRPKYAKLGHGLNNAAQLAEQRITQLMGN